MATYANQTKTASTFSGINPTRPELLVESGFNLLVGEGFKLDIERAFGNEWTSSNKSSTAFADAIKN